MKRLYTLLILLVVLSQGFAQQARQVNIKDIKVNLNDKTKEIEISYDVDNLAEKDSVFILVQNRQGTKFKCVTLRGDIGTNIQSGDNKMIYWNFIADSLRINEEISFTIKVKMYDDYSDIKTPANTTPSKPVVIADNPVIEKNQVPKPPKTKKLNLPMVAALGVGVLAGGYMVYDGLQQQGVAAKYYQSYQSDNWNQKVTVSDDEWLKNYSQGTISSAETMLSRAQDKLKKANMMLYAGIGVIVADAILTIPRLKRKQIKNVTFTPDIIPATGTFMLGASYKF